MTDNAEKRLLVLTNLPDQETALGLARALVEKRLAACVNVLDGCTSVYRWQGAIETAREVPLLIKTRAECFASLKEEILLRHPYDLPEIIAFVVEQGHEPYLTWIGAETDISS